MRLKSQRGHIDTADVSGKWTRDVSRSHSVESGFVLRLGAISDGRIGRRLESFDLKLASGQVPVSPFQKQTTNFSGKASSGDKSSVSDLLQALSFGNIPPVLDAGERDGKEVVGGQKLS